MARYLVFSAASFLLMAIVGASAQARLDRSCRQEIVSLCGKERDGMRACIRENRDRLSADCTAQLREQIRNRTGRKTALSRADPAAVTDGRIIFYGADELQKLRFYRATTRNAPLLVFVHGGGWKRGDMDAAAGPYKPAHFQGRGFAFATVNYRLVPDATVEQQAADVAAATAALQRRAQSLGFDPERIFLMGHSAGAHLSALVGTDLSYLRNAGVHPTAVRGAILLDGAAYDVPEQRESGNRLMKETYVAAFGSDPARQRKLSPSYHADSPSLSAFLILHVDRQDAKQQSERLAQRLNSHGSKADVLAIAGKGMSGHRDINQKLGKSDYPATAIVDRWLAARLR